MSKSREKVDKYINGIEGVDYVVCPLCGKKYSRLKSHLLKSHENFNLNEYLETHPDFKLISDKLRNKIINNTKNYAKLHPDEMIRRANLSWEKGNLYEIRQEQCKRQWSDPEFVAMKTENSHQTMLRLNRDKEFSKMAMKNLVNWKHREYWYNGINYRSQSEADLAKLLDDNHINYEYETLKIPYIFNNEEHTYTIDFYLPDYNLIVEVKPKEYQDDKVVKIKLESCKNLGYNILIISNPLQINSYLKSYNKCAETIESIGLN